MDILYWHKSEIVKSLFSRFPQLEIIESDIKSAAEVIIDSFGSGGKLLICGNGGSAADCGHIAGELVKGFEKKRHLDVGAVNSLIAINSDRGKFISERLQKGFPAISLTVHDSLITAFANDVDPDLIYAQQVYAYGRAGDVLLALSTSGNSRNVIDAIITAKAFGLGVIGMTGRNGGAMNTICDTLIKVPEDRTCYVQELHLPIYHAICLITEDYFYEYIT